jgi:flagellar hook-associated protein 1 FlgK
MSLAVATQHLQTIAQELSIISQNVASADIEGNEEIVMNIQSLVSVQNQPMGSAITSYENNVDPLVQAEIYAMLSEVYYDNQFNVVYNFLDSLMGTPGDYTDISSQLSSVYNNLQLLSSNPYDIGLRRSTIDQLTNVTNLFSSIAQQIENERFQLDNQIYSQIQTVNQIVETAYNYQTIAMAATPGSLDYLTNNQLFRASLEDLSQYVNFSQVADGLTGKTYIFLNGGQGIITDNYKFFKYIPSSSLLDMVNDIPLNPLYVSSYNSAGVDTNQNIAVVTGGTTSQRINTLGSGQLAALVDLRDTLLPNALNQIDSLAKGLKDAFNSIHNDGVGFPSPNVLTGTTNFAPDQELGFTGVAYIAVVDDYGNPVVLEDSNGNPLLTVPPLTLDLGNLNTGNGAGNPNVEGIMNEINYYFGDKLNSMNRLTLGNITDTKLAFTSSTIAPATPFTLDFDIENLSPEVANFSVDFTTLLIDDPTASIQLVNNANNAVSLISGQTTRTSYMTNGPILQITPGATIPATYNASMNISVTANGITSTSNVTFTINTGTNYQDYFNGFINQRVQPTAASSISGTVVLNTTPPTQSNVISAALVDDTGLYLNGTSDTPGLLQLNTNNASWHLVISNGTSTDIGVPSIGVAATGDTFSAFFGLNDLFQRTDASVNWNNTANTAYYLTVRPDIINNPMYLAVATAQAYVNYSQPTVPTYMLQVSEGNFDNGSALYNSQNLVLSFPAAGNLPARNVNILNYAADIINNISLECYNDNVQNEVLNSQLSALQTNFYNAKGVNINEQMIMLINLVNAQTAQSKIVAIDQKFYDYLMQAIIF